MFFKKVDDRFLNFCYSKYVKNFHKGGFDMREYNENNIGKLVMKNIGSVYIVSGYDFLLKDYILLEVEKKEYSSYHRYIPMSDELYSNLTDYDGIISLYDKELETRKEIYNIYISPEQILNDKNKKEYFNIYNRLYQANLYIHSIGWCSNNPKEKKFWERELVKAKKGIRRALKRLYHYLPKDMYGIMEKYLIEKNYPDMNSFRKEQEFILKEKESFIKGYRIIQMKRNSQIV